LLRARARSLINLESTAGCRYGDAGVHRELESTTSRVPGTCRLTLSLTFMLRLCPGRKALTIRPGHVSMGAFNTRWQCQHVHRCVYVEYARCQRCQRHALVSILKKKVNRCDAALVTRKKRVTSSLLVTWFVEKHH
jgi:hypothetical protein